MMIKSLKSFFIFGLVLIVSGCGCNFKKNQENDDINEKPEFNMEDQVIGDQEIENQIFAEQTNLVTVNSESTLTTQIHNNSEEDVYIYYIDIIFKNENDEVIEKLIGFVDDTIKSGDSYYMVTGINDDLSETKKIEYKINY